MMQASIKDAVRVATVAGKSQPKLEAAKAAAAAAEVVTVTVPEATFLLHQSEHLRLVDLQVANHKRIKQLETENASLQRRHDGLRQTIIELLQEARRGSEIRMITLTHVVMESGDMYQVGDQIYEGHYAGRTITSIDHPTRLVTLDDKTVLRMSADPRRHADRRLQAEAAINRDIEEQGSSGIPTALRGTGSESDTPGSRPAIHDTDHNQFRSTAVDPRATIHLDAGGLLDHDRRQPGVPAGDN